MLHCITAVLLFAASIAAAPPRPPAAPKTIAPATMPHQVAMFLANLSSDGKQKVTYKATARGTHFFFEEPQGVTVYVYDGDGYRKETFLKGATLTSALQRYRAKR